MHAPAGSGPALRVHGQPPVDGRHLGAVRGRAASFRFIAKKQLAGIPLFGWAMGAGRFIFIDRQNAAGGPPEHRPGRAPHPGGPVGGDLPRGDALARRPAGAVQEGRLPPGHRLGRRIVPVAIKGSRELMPRGAALISAGTVTRRHRRAHPDRRPEREDRDALIDAGPRAASRRCSAKRPAGRPPPTRRFSRSRAAGSGRAAGAVMPPAVRSPVASMSATPRLRACGRGRRRPACRRRCAPCS